MFLRLMIIAFMFISFCAKALTVKTIVSGDWENPSTWSTHQVPSNPDSVIVSHYITLNQNLTLGSPIVLFINSSGTICGNYTLETLCGASFINYGYMYLDQIKTRAGANYNEIQCKSSITLVGCSSGGGYFNSYAPNGHVEVWPPVFCKTQDTNWESGTLTGLPDLQNVTLTIYPNVTLTIYPNPLADRPLIILAKGTVGYRLTDIAGILMLANTFKDKEELDLRDLPSGLYFLELNMEGKKQIRKIIKAN